MELQKEPNRMLCEDCVRQHRNFADLFEKSIGKPRSHRIGPLKHAQENKRVCSFCNFLVEAYELAHDVLPGQISPNATGKETIFFRIDVPPPESVQPDNPERNKIRTSEQPWYHKAGMKANLPPAPALWLQFSTAKGGDVAEPLVCVSCIPRALTDRKVIDMYHRSLPRRRNINESHGGFVSYGLIQLWLKICCEQHGDSCGQATKYQRQTLGLKLIDVFSREVKAVQDDSPYVALSYVWGKVIRQNYGFKWPLRKKGMPENRPWGPVKLPRNLPQTIEDAMVVVGSLGIQYLWVDFFCINQNDSTEKQEQIDKMHLFYECAFLTIIAVDGADVNSGLAGVSLLRQLKQTRQPTVETEYGEFMATYVHSTWDHQGNAPWDLRAWTLQELLLSRRSVLFDGNHISMICREERFHDLMYSEIGHNRMPAQKGDTYFWDNGFASDLHGEEWDFSQFDSLLANYTRRTLTDQSDILAACTGALNQITKKTGVGFLWGLPQIDMHRALHWKPHPFHASPIRRPGKLESPSGKPKSTSGPPSWSWAGWQGRTDYQHCFDEWDAYQDAGRERAKKRLAAMKRKRQVPELDHLVQNHSAFITTSSAQQNRILQISSSIAQVSIKKIRARNQAVPSVPKDSELPFDAVGDQWAVLNDEGVPMINHTGEAPARFEQTDFFFQTEPTISDLLEVAGSKFDLVFIKYWPWLRDSDIYGNWLDDIIGVLFIMRNGDDTAWRVASLLLKLEQWVAANPQPGVVNLV